MKRAEIVANKILQTRGYMVFKSSSTYFKGQLVHGICDNRDRRKHRIGYPVVVIGETDRADFEVQAALFGYKSFDKEPDARYWRAVAE